MLSCFVVGGKDLRHDLKSRLVDVRDEQKYESIRNNGYHRSLLVMMKDAFVRAMMLKVAEG